MVDSISVIRQMMAESKNFEALTKVEMHLSTDGAMERKSLLPIYLELLELQDKRLPEDLLVEVIENLIDEEMDESIKWLAKLPKNASFQTYRRVQLLKIKIAEKKGRLDQLYTLISELNLHSFETRVPAKIEYIESLVLKFFKHDFHIKLQELALVLMLGDITKAEVHIRELIVTCVEKIASSKGTKEKLLAIAEIIKTQKEKKHLEIYQNYCNLHALGVENKSGYKKLGEMVIYFDDFKLQVLLLDLIEKLSLLDVASQYAKVVKENTSYDFVYIEKYFVHLKKYFSRPTLPKRIVTVEDADSPDYTLEAPLSPLPATKNIIDPQTEEEVLLISSLKFQNYSSGQLIELAISFLQSSYLRAAIVASEKAMHETSLNEEYLKAAYLRATSLYQLGDFRAVLDQALDSINRAEVQDDILSFLYLQADAYSRLGQKKHAKSVLKKILSIDSKYRLTRERLERLDEI